MERRTIYFSGQVQGVGFRYATARAAAGLALDGTVRNLPDGRVELIVSGSHGDIEALLDRLREQFGSGVRNIQQSVDSVLTGEQTAPGLGKGAAKPGSARGGRIRIVH